MQDYEKTYIDIAVARVDNGAFGVGVQLSKRINDNHEPYKVASIYYEGPFTTYFKR